MGLTPAPIEGLDDLDHLIYDLYYRQHLSLRGVAAEVGMSHAGVSYRLKRMMPWLRPEDHEQLRDEEGTRLTELRNQQLLLAKQALEGGDVAAASKMFREIHAITRTMIQLYGLEVRADDPPAADPDRLNSLIDAYLQGAADATTPAGG